MANSNMKISLPGVLERAADACGRNHESRYLEFPLRELLGHLRMVRADPSRIGEFLELWTDDAAAVAAAAREAGNG